MTQHPLARELDKSLKGGAFPPLFEDKLGFVEMFAQIKAIVSSTFSKVALHEQWRGQGRVALAIAFLFIAFLCASSPKEKRLTTFDSKGLLTLFSLALEPPSFLSNLRQPFANAKPKAKKALQKRNGVFALTPRGRSLLKKRRKTIIGFVQTKCSINQNLN